MLEADGFGFDGIASDRSRNDSKLTDECPHSEQHMVLDSSLPKTLEKKLVNLSL